MAAGVVDIAVPPEAMPAALQPHLGDGAVPPHPPAPPNESLDEVLAIVAGRTTIDFRAYKTGTLRRRIERRMRLRRLDDPAAFARYLRHHPAEVDQLARDLLIRVTSFFREPSAFDELASGVVAPLARVESEVPIRIWVPGCATGEEAYSMAIVVAEQLDAAHSGRRFQIFASDVDRHAVEIGRTGVYPATISLDVPEPRLRRFFTRADGAFKVAPALRESVVFAVHDVLRDPPFSRLDVVSCRNLLIYLQPPAQRRLMGIFHRSLSPGGHLVLGASETVGRAAELFAVLSPGSHIYSRLDGVSPPFVLAPARSARRRAGRAPVRPRLAQPSLATLASQRLLARFAPPAVVVTDSGRLLHVFGRIGEYFDLPIGAPNLDAAAMIREPYKAAFLDVVRQASAGGTEVSAETARGARPGTRVRFTAVPLSAPAGERTSILVTIEPPPST